MIHRQQSPEALPREGLASTTRPAYVAVRVHGRGHPSALSEVLARVMRDKLTGAAREEVLALRVFTAFERIGPPLTDQAEPILFRHGVLTLRVKSSVWLTELTFLKTELLERLEQHLGRRAVRDVRLRLGHVEPRPIEPSPRRALAEADRARIADWTEAIADPKVREALSRAAARCLERGPADFELPAGPPGPMPSPDRKPAEPAPETILTYGFGRREVDRWAPPPRGEREDG
jgi:hypothetical protein